MIKLPLSLESWGSAEFRSTFNDELRNLDAGLLPLQQGLQYSSYVISDRLAAIILKTQEDTLQITIKAGLAYNGIIAGCSCSDDPTPLDETSEYCEVQLCINKKTAETTVTLLS